MPPQLKVALSAGGGPIAPGEDFPIDVEASYYYGAPGAELAVEAEATIAFDEDPFPNEPGFQFGLAPRSSPGRGRTSMRRQPTATANRPSR